LGTLTISMLRGAAGNQSKEVRRLTQWLRSEGRPEMLLLSNMLIAGGVPTWKQELGVPVVALLQGDDAFLDYLPSPYREQATDAIRDLAKQVDGFLCHSEFYARRMAERFDLARDRVFVTPLGIDVADFATRQANPADARPPTIGYLARLAPDKGFHLLVDAFIKLSERPDSLQPRLLAAGWLSAQHRDFAESQFAKLRQRGLESRFEYRGVVDRRQKCAMLAECDLFSVPTETPEPKGLFALEAMAAGVPVVLPAEGAFPELLAAAGAGWQFPPRDTDALAETLHRALADGPQRMAAAQIGRQFVLEHRNAERTADETIRVLNQIWQAAQRRGR
jgi:glycosyltransferase involved in cell wall biosynthesis